MQLSSAVLAVASAIVLSALYYLVTVWRLKRNRYGHDDDQSNEWELLV